MGDEQTLLLLNVAIWTLVGAFQDRSDLDDAAGPFRMEVRSCARGGPPRTSVDHAAAFEVARAFFTKHLS